MHHKISTGMVSILLSGLAWAQLDLNQAREMELDGLHGIGPSMTRQIMHEREKAPFRDWADVMQRIKGIGPQKAASLSEQGLRVQGQTYDRTRAAPPQKP